MNCLVYSGWISYNAPRCAKSAEKSGFKLIKSGGLSLKTDARVLFSPSENGTSTHFILISGFCTSNSFITLFIYGAKSFICKVQNTTSLPSFFCLVGIEINIAPNTIKTQITLIKRLFTSYHSLFTTCVIIIL